MGRDMDWKHLLAYITGSVDQELLVRNEYLVTENRILRQQIPGRVRLSDGERICVHLRCCLYKTMTFFLMIGVFACHRLAFPAA